MDPLNVCAVGVKDWQDNSCIGGLPVHLVNRLAARDAAEDNCDHVGTQGAMWGLLFPFATSQLPQLAAYNTALSHAPSSQLSAAFALCFAFVDEKVSSDYQLSPTQA